MEMKLVTNGTNSKKMKKKTKKQTKTHDAWKEVTVYSTQERDIVGKQKTITILLPNTKKTVRRIERKRNGL